MATLITSDFFLEPYIAIVEQYATPYTMFECKRVGVEEGARKGPQTIEKAKQGAYVAKAVSSLHKLRTASGELHGIIYKPDSTIYSKPYDVKSNQFTKVQMRYDADRVLENYFTENTDLIEKWFNIITPKGRSISELRTQISLLRQKNWKTIHAR